MSFSKKGDRKNILKFKHKANDNRKIGELISSKAILAEMLNKVLQEEGSNIVGRLRSAQLKAIMIMSHVS